MFDTYQDIFNVRGHAYHQAMAQYPDARRREFELLVEQAEPRRGQIICDAPAGGGYVRHYMPSEDITLIAVETSPAFYQRCPVGPGLRRVLCPLHELPLPASSIDTVISLAGLHHVEEKRPVFAEIRRILCNHGRLCIADVADDSPVAVFLDRFVNDHNSMGHEGEFIDDGVRRDLEGAGFALTHDRMHRYEWTFASEEDMVCYCTLLFGLDRADPDQVLEGIRRHLGYETDERGCRMNWELAFLTGTNRAA